MTRIMDIGIFAHNEEERIPALIRDIGRQSVFGDFGTDLRVHLLANGCSDGTVAAAGAAIAALPEDIRDRFAVLDLPLGGKSRTGHRFIHELSRPAAGTLCFMDADIRLPAEGTLLGMLDELSARPELRAFSSRPVKDVEHNDLPVGLAARMIAAGGGGLADYRKAICGQLFMLRASAARRIGLPVGLPVEDGFIRAMILTDLLSRPEDMARIDGRDDLYHVYESIRTPGELIRHQTRIVVGGAINTALFGKVAREAPTEPQAHALLMSAADRDDWLARALREELPQWPYGYVHFEFMTLRMRRGPKARDPKALAIWLIGCGLDTLVYGLATLRLMRGRGAHFW